MSKMSLRRAAVRARSRRQAFVLLILGVLCLLGVWLLNYNVYNYPVGVLLLGVGILIAAFINPFRLMAAGWLITALGIATYLTFTHLIPGGQVLAYYILAIGVALFIIALTARQGYIRAGAITPALLIILVGILEFLLAANLTPSNFIPFMLSLWLPGIGLLVLGLIYFLIGGRE
jgi:hypothetical protein